MKRIFIYTAVLVSSLLFITSCAKDPIGNTATEKMAGEWYVTAASIDSNGNVVYDDLFGIGKFHLDTYNLASNTADSMWVFDNQNFWDFKCKVEIDQKTLTFSADTAFNYEYQPSHVTITNGKILLGAATTPSGVAADSIVFTVSFDDDPYPAKYGYAAYRVSGFRYTGFTKDE